MNLSDCLTYSVLLLMLVAFGVVIGWRLRSAKESLPLVSSQVIVNVPPDWKPLDTLPPTQIDGARATLWWTVFNAAKDEYDYSDTAIKCADAAVDKVFGPLPS